MSLLNLITRGFSESTSLIEGNCVAYAGKYTSYTLLNFTKRKKAGFSNLILLVVFVSRQNMFLSRNEYDHGVNTFSPEGRIFQVEYALEAIKLGSTAVGICTSEGVVLAVEKRIISPLLVPQSVEKVMKIDAHIGAAMSGITADARTLVEHARVECANHKFNYDEPITIQSCTQALCDLALRFGEGKKKGEKKSGAKMSRPFGVALLVAGVDEKGPSLFHADPSGTFIKYMARAIGAGSENAQPMLDENYHKSMTFQEAEILALKTLKQVMEDKVSSINVEFASVLQSNKKFVVYSTEMVEKIIESSQLDSKSGDDIDVDATSTSTK